MRPADLSMRDNANCSAGAFVRKTIIKSYEAQIAARPQINAFGGADRAISKSDLDSKAKLRLRLRLRLRFRSAN